MLRIGQDRAKSKLLIISRVAEVSSFLEQAVKKYQMPEPASLPDYKPEDFADVKHGSKCDVIMKGGITSGIVYPYAITEIAKKFRLTAIGGTSAGGIAAAFSAAAEYARSKKEPSDPAGFVRLQQICDQLPETMPKLFHPRPEFKTVFKILMQAQASGNFKKALWLQPFCQTVGIAIALLVFGLWSFSFYEYNPSLVEFAKALIPGLILAGLFYLVSSLIAALCLVGFILFKLLKLGEGPFGICSGLTESHGEGAGLLDWLHEGIQEIAFGENGRKIPLLFGDLEQRNNTKSAVQLRMITTNLSMHRPHMLPHLNMDAYFKKSEWDQLFPCDVMDYLTGKTEAFENASLDEDGEYWHLPTGEDMPVIIAVRMSLSFPVLFTSIPLWVFDEASSYIKKQLRGAAAVDQSASDSQNSNLPDQLLWFSDGGISSNFPIHMFDSFLPGRPTFALSLDDLPKSIVEREGDKENPERRVLIPRTKSSFSGLPAMDIHSFGPFAGSILNSAKDWQDKLLARMPGQRERIARIYLSADQGGLNLSMSKESSKILMSYGFEVGRRFANGALNFKAHRRNRALVAFEQLEDTVRHTSYRWQRSKYELLFKSRIPNMTIRDIKHIQHGFTGFAKMTEHFTTELRGKDKKMPRPAGKLTITPII